MWFFYIFIYICLILFYNYLADFFAQAGRAKESTVSDRVRMSEPRLIAVGKQIRKARKARGWTQEYLASELGITRQTLIAMEKGRGCRPNFHRLECLEKLIGCSLLESIGSVAPSTTQDVRGEEEQIAPQVAGVMVQLTLLPGDCQEGALRLIAALLQWYKRECSQDSRPGMGSSID